MKKLMIGSIVLSALQFSSTAYAEQGVSVYCDTAFSEYQHSVWVDDVVRALVGLHDADSHTLRHRVYNIAAGTPSVKAMADAAREGGLKF